MKKMTKIFAVFLASVAISQSVFAYGPFSDVESTHTNLEAIIYAQDMGIIDGYPDGTFKPNGAINRAELMKMVVEMVAGTPDSGLYGNCFPDVNNEWFAPYVCLAKENGWVDGYPNGTFKPANNVNRAEALKIILNAATNANLDKDFGQAILNGTYYTDIDQNAWYYPYFEYAAAGRLIDMEHGNSYEDGTFEYFPGGNMSRKEVAETIFRYRTMENNGLAQYNEMYGPYGYSMDYGIRSGLGDKHGYDADDVEISIIDAEGGYVYGNLVFGDGGPGQGGWFYAMVYEGGWVTVGDGNGVMYCDILEENGFPQSMMEGCYETEI